MDYVWAAAALPFAVLWLVAARSAKRAARRADALAAELEALKAKPVVWEARIDRHDLLWFPQVTADPKRQAVTAVAAGVPHCKPCLKPMAIHGQEWVCAGCGQRRPESVADLMIIDGVSKEAVTQFLQRRTGWRSAL